MEQRGSVFLFGTGRSGTTVVLRMMASHPELAWFSTYNERFVRFPALAFLSRFRNLDATSGNFAGWMRFLPMPAEAIEVPRFVTDASFQSQQPLGKKDIDSRVVDRYREYIHKVTMWQGKKRFLHKHTGFARTIFLNQLDSTGQFIQIIRDGRAVAYSLMRVKWWDGSLRSWWWGTMPDEYKEEYERSDRNPVVLAGIVWKHLLDLTSVEIEILPAGRILTIRYTDLVSQPEAQILEICKHCALDMTEQFEGRLSRFRIRNADEAWSKGLTSKQIKLLDRSLEKHLQRFGFKQ